MNFSDFSEISAAALGALLLWGFQLWDKIRDRNRMRESTLVAIASEVNAICRLIRTKRYLEAFTTQEDAIRNDEWDKNIYIIDVRGNYFKSFDAFIPSLSFIPPYQVSKIVSFYTYCQSAIDSTRPDGPAATTENLGEKVETIISTKGLLTSILLLGDEIVQFPKCALPTQ